MNGFHSIKNDYENLEVGVQRKVNEQIKAFKPLNHNIKYVNWNKINNLNNIDFIYLKYFKPKISDIKKLKKQM